MIEHIKCQIYYYLPKVWFNLAKYEVIFLNKFCKSWVCSSIIIIIEEIVLVAWQK